MFKVSFNKDSEKIRKLDDRTTEVTLTGTMHMPDAWQLIPSSISDWIAWRSFATSISTDFNAADEAVIIKVKGRARRHPDDTENPIVAERIAESRAKIRLYHFMCTLLYKLCEYYSKLLYGTDGVVNPTKQGLTGAFEKYEALYIKESYHLGKLLEKS